MFYKAVVQTVLIFGAESWAVSKRMLSALEGFHHQIDRRLTGRTPMENRRYLNGRKRCPLSLEKGGPKTKADALFQEVKSYMEETEARPHRWKTWISQETWDLIDRRSALRRRRNKNTNAEGRRLMRCIMRAIKRDRLQRTTDFGVAIEAMLERKNSQGAWRALQAWYKHTRGRGSKPSRRDLKKLATEYEDLILIFFIYFNCACTYPIILYTQQTEREPQYPAPACTTLLYFNGTPTVGSIMKKWTNFAASVTRVLDVGLKKFKNPVHSGQFAGCTRLGVVNAKDTFGGTYGCHSVFHSV
jgi:hypothetical protein